MRPTPCWFFARSPSLARVSAKKEITIPTVEEVHAALAQVKDPALSRSLQAANMLREVSVEGGKVRLNLQLTTPACPSRDAIAASVATLPEQLRRSLTWDLGA